MWNHCSYDFAAKYLSWKVLADLGHFFLIKQSSTAENFHEAEEARFMKVV
jgi:hypothetical protein